jgi:ribosomal protein S12 methylthiotransferase
MKIYFDTLGCDKNTVDNEYLAGLLRQRGFSLANRDGSRDFDAVVVTTCGFIAAAQRQSLEHILEWVEEKRRRRRPMALFVSGCLSQQYGEKIREQVPEIDGIAGVGDFDKLADAIERSLRAQAESKNIAPFYLVNDKPVVDIPRDLPREPLYDAAYSYLKISDGCNHNCSFCAIPSMKGRHKSVARELLLEETRRLAGKGVREINIVAQDASDYGKDLYDNYRLNDLLADIAAVPGDFWIRLFYLYPLGVTDELLALWREEPKLARYVDMPLQHLSPTVMRRMKRPHLEAKIDETIARLRTVPDFTLRTTFIVGFPGETEEDIQLLLEGMERYEFNRLGVFTYSPEEATPSFALPGHIAEEEKRRRRDLVMARQAEISQRLSERKIGKRLRVLAESRDPRRKRWLCRSEADAPEIDGLVYVPGGQDLMRAGEFFDVEVTGAEAYDLQAKLVSDRPDAPSGGVDFLDALALLSAPAPGAKSQS